MGLASGKRAQYLQTMGIQTWSLRQPLNLEARILETTIEIAPDPIVDKVADVIESVPIISASSIESTGVSIPEQQTTTAEQIPDWKCLEVEVKACIQCELSQQRTQTVFGVGDRDADWFVIGEAPGVDEDTQGEPFVGRAGQLLNQMLLAVGLRREQVYIANIVKCRPPGNRDPKAEEATACETYLRQQIALVKPKIILAVGRVAAQNLLKVDHKVGAMRDSELYYGEQNIPVVVTYHPAYLLRKPSEKRKSWQDLLRAQQIVNSTE